MLPPYQLAIKVMYFVQTQIMMKIHNVTFIFYLTVNFNIKWTPMIINANITVVWYNYNKEKKTFLNI